MLTSTGVLLLGSGHYQHGGPRRRPLPARRPARWGVWSLRAGGGPPPRRPRHRRPRPRRRPAPGGVARPCRRLFLPSRRPRRHRSSSSLARGAAGSGSKVGTPGADTATSSLPGTGSASATGVAGRAAAGSGAAITTSGLSARGWTAPPWSSRRRRRSSCRRRRRRPRRLRRHRTTATAASRSAAKSAINTGAPPPASPSCWPAPPRDAWSPTATAATTLAAWSRVLRRAPRQPSLRLRPRRDEPQQPGL